MAKFETDKKKVVTYFNKSLEEMTLKLIDAKGFENFQDVIKQSVRLMYDGAFPAYANRPLSTRLNRTPEERAQDDLDAKASVIEKKRAQAVSMCEALGGEVRGGACHYKTFTKAYGTKVHAGVSSISLETISQETLDKQFINTTREEAIEQGLM